MGLLRLLRLSKGFRWALREFQKGLKVVSRPSKHFKRLQGDVKGVSVDFREAPWSYQRSFKTFQRCFTGIQKSVKTFLGISVGLKESEACFWELKEAYRLLGELRGVSGALDRALWSYSGFQMSNRVVLMGLKVLEGVTVRFQEVSGGFRAHHRFSGELRMNFRLQSNFR